MSKTPLQLSKNFLVKFVAHSGLCSRRKAEELIKTGEISVNNYITTDPSYLVQERDTIRYKKKILTEEVADNFYYIALNKPANTICTSHDPDGRPTVHEFTKHLNPKNTRLYTIGRLDRNTTGIILLTNDGALAQRMTHPSFNILKTYAVTLHKPLPEERLEQIKRGVQLDDCFIRVDSIEFAQQRKNSPCIFISIHSGKNRIIRRIFEQMGCFIEKLERVSFGPISKKGLAIGQARFLNTKEIATLRKILE